MSFRRYNYGRRSEFLLAEEENFGLVLPQGYSKTAKGKWLAGEDKDWYIQVSYAFPEDFRSNIAPKGTYGGKGITMRRLYAILSDGFYGKPFLDYYFEEVFPALKEDFKMQYLTPLKNSMLRFYETTEIQSLLTDKFLAELGYGFSLEIKEDIKNCVATGRIPYALAESTKERRQQAGIERDSPFYATGQLIDSIIVLCEIRNRKWRKPRKSLLEEINV